MSDEALKKRVSNCMPSKSTEKNLSIQDAKTSGILPPEGTPIPDHCDLREDWWTVGNQGETGSGVAWAVADGVLRWKFVKAGLLQPDELLSVKYLWMASKEEGDYRMHEDFKSFLLSNSKEESGKTGPVVFINSAGCTLFDTLKITQYFGIVPDTLLPFNVSPPTEPTEEFYDVGKSAEDHTFVHITTGYINGFYNGSEDDFYTVAAKLKIKSHYELFRGMNDKVMACKHWLGNGKGPVAILLKPDQNWHKAWEGKDAANLNTYEPIPNDSTGSGGHAACVVGYTPDSVIIRHSWGTEFGDLGFVYASNDYFNNACIEAYGVHI